LSVAAAGSFAFGDADYAKNMRLGGQQGEWQQSLWVLTQVMYQSLAAAGATDMSCPYKTLRCCRSRPHVHECAVCVLLPPGDEHASCWGLRYR
jgi:hypothetical protein